MPNEMPGEMPGEIPDELLDELRMLNDLVGGSWLNPVNPPVPSSANTLVPLPGHTPTPSFDDTPVPAPDNTPVRSDDAVGSPESDTTELDMEFIQHITREPLEPLCTVYEWQQAHETIDFEIVCQPPDFVRAGKTLGRPIVVRSRSVDLVADASRPGSSLEAQAILLRKFGEHPDGSPRWYNVSLHTGYHAWPVIVPIKCRGERVRRRAGTSVYEDWVYFVFPEIKMLRLTREDEYHIDIEMIGSNISANYGRRSTRPFEVLPWRLPEWAVPECLELSKFFCSVSFSGRRCCLQRPLLDTNSLCSR